MPLVYQQNINPYTKLGVWHIEEEEDFFNEKMMLPGKIRNDHKRLQHLAGRYLLTELYPDFPVELIKVADTNKPFLTDEVYHFSISHCGNYAAVIISSTHRVGIDIEIISEKAKKVKHKFLSEDEQIMIKKTFNNEYSESSLFTLLWSIKETMFKWNGLANIDFKKHLKIHQIEQSQKNEFVARCAVSKSPFSYLKVNGLIFYDNLLTWTLT